MTRRRMETVARRFAAVALAMTVAAMPALADKHVLTIEQLRTDLTQAASTRLAQQATLDGFFSLPRVQTTLRNAGVDVEQIRTATYLMGDEEKSKLAARVSAAQSAIVGGELSNSQVTLIILAIAGFCYLAVLILAFQ